MINEAKLPNKWLSALLPVLLVLSLAACSSSDEQSDTSGGTSEGTDCSDQPTDRREMECEAGKEIVD
jgi:hypothetical protein